MSPALELTTCAGTFSVCRLAPDSPIPPWALGDGALTSVTRTAAELSIVCPTQAVPSGVRAEGPFTAFAVRGPLDFGLTGILAGLASALAAADVSIFAISTYDTDYVLVPARDATGASETLRAAGYGVD